MATQDEKQAIETLQDLGITRKQAIKALARYGYDVGRAADYIFSGLAESDSDSEPASPATDPAPSLPVTKNHQPALRAKRQGQQFVKDFGRNASDDSAPSYEPSMWSMVPASSSKLTNNTPSLTWWIDPEDPSDRLADPEIPVGLRPPGYNFAFAPVVIQSLFHITAFRHRVLSYRPTATDWGSSKDYWSGNGEPVSSTIDPADSSEQPKQLPNSVKCVAELQKLFVFLAHSERQYGNVDPVVQALNCKTPNPNSWGSQDVSADEFIDLTINALLEADNHRDVDQAKDDFRSMFSLLARVEYTRETETEEIFYLALGFNEHTLSFHSCLGPLVFESSKVEDASDLGSLSSDDASSDSDKAYKITTFERVPPILVVSLEDKTLKSKGNHRSVFQVDQTLYMDRYLHENRDKVLESYKQAQTWKEEISTANVHMAKLRNNNVTDEQGKIVTIDKRLILTKTMDYFKDHTDEAMQSVQTVLGEIRESITTRIKDLEELVKQRTDQLHTLFDGPEYQKAPYDVRAILHHDGMSGTGHYWGYIWVEPGEENLLQSIPDDEGGWFRFCDASVRPSNKDEVFSETTSPFAVIYVDRKIPSYSKAAMTNFIPRGLQDFVHRDNVGLVEEIRTFNRNDRIIEERMDSPQQTTSNHENSDDDDDDDDDAGSIGTAVGENGLTTRQNEQNELVADNGSFNLSHNQSLQSLSSSFEEDIQRPMHQTSPSSSIDSSLEEKLSNYVHVLLVSVESYSGDDYRLIKSFESFLGKLRDVSALEHFVFMYTERYENDDTIIREEESRSDPYLTPLWQEFDSYVSITRVVTSGLDEFAKGQYLDALLYFIQAQQEEAKWKTHLLVETEMFTQVPNVQALGFSQVILRFGKQCIKVLDDNARSKATEAAYRTRGLQDAINIARYAQTIIGPEKLSTDSLFGEMRESWLKFSELQGGYLEGSQADLLNTLIMAYLEAESTWSSEPALLAPMSANDSSDSEPVWQKYKKASQAAAARLNSL